MTNLEKAKEVIKEHFNSGDCGLFDCRNCVGDIMDTIYEDESITIDICYFWSYFEVFGLTQEEFSKLQRFYERMKRIKRNR